MGIMCSDEVRDGDGKWKFHWVDELGVMGMGMMSVGIGCSREVTAMIKSVGDGMMGSNG